MSLLDKVRERRSATKPSKPAPDVAPTLDLDLKQFERLMGYEGMQHSPRVPMTHRHERLQPLEPGTLGAVVAECERYSIIPSGATQAEAKAPKKLTGKALSKAITDTYYKFGAGVTIDMMSIPKIYKAAETAYAAATTPEEGLAAIETSIKASLQQYAVSMEAEAKPKPEQPELTEKKGFKGKMKEMKESLDGAYEMSLDMGGGPFGPKGKDGAMGEKLMEMGALYQECMDMMGGDDEDA